MNVDLEIKQYLELLSAEQKSSVLELLKKFVSKKDRPSAEYTLLQYNLELEAAVERVKNGDYLTHDEVLKESEQW
ncbi:MAG: hypothetical protein K2X48_00940 [Chitinophagaceae bacterium]|nr:hypothetical protein [Chitinophagaceae bacterium]